MDISAVIIQLRTYCPVLKVVGGAADFQKGLETVVNPAQLPAAFVLPDGDEAETNMLQNGLIQTVREKVQIVVEFDNSGDRRGFIAANQVESMKYSLFQALLNWRIDPIRAQKGLEYAGASYVEMDRGRMWYTFGFALVVSIDDEDGFQIDATPLTNITVDVTLEDTAAEEPAPDEPVTVDVYFHNSADMSIRLQATAGNLSTHIS